MPRKDVVLLPLIFVLTTIVLLAAGEITARLLYAQDDAREPCEFLTSSSYRYKPFCTSRTKVWEGPWITQRFNDCGYRTAESCTLRPAGALRVAVIGSSTARGALVNYPESFAARASAWLSDRCGGTVDFQNLGTEPPDVDRIDQRIPEALALRPSTIVMTIGPYDLIHLKDPPPNLAGAASQDVTRDDRTTDRRLLNLRRAVALLRDSRLFLLMQYYLYRDPAFEIRAFLLNGDPADYVRAPLSPAWRQRVSDFGDLLGRITAQTEPAHVPVILVYIPERAQAALARLTTNQPGIDPLVLDNALAKEAAQRGVVFVDSTPAFAKAPDFQSLFYLTDGHPRPTGHAAIAQTVERALLSEPQFARCLKSEPTG